MNLHPAAIAAPQSVDANYAFLQTVVESLVDGVLLITVQGEWVYGNHNAHRICQHINPEKPISGCVPEPIRQICQTFLKNHNQLNHSTQLESEMMLDQVLYRVRVRWFQREEIHTPFNTPLLIVTLEDCYQAARNRAIAEAEAFNLTERQADVWLLHRTGCTYREIATRLFVTINTVKRHMKDIHAKQRLKI